MAAIIKIQIETSGGLDAVKKDLNDLSKTAEQSGGGFNALSEIAVGALRKIGELGIGLVLKGFEALGSAVADGIADAQKNVQIQAQTAAVLKSTGNAAGRTTEQIADYASSLSDAAGTSLFGDDQIQESTNLLLTFTNIKDTTLDAATAISVDMAQALGGEPKDAAIQLGKALNDPIKGITALTRVGVTFSEEQKAQIKVMQESGDTAGAQAIILAELNKEFGGSAAAAADATGGWSEFNGRMGEAKEALGAALLPLLGQLAGVLLDTVLPAIEGLAARFGPFVESLQPAIATLTGFIGGLLASFADTSPLDAFTAASTTLGTFWSTTLKPAFDAVWTVLQTQVMPILNDLGTIIGAVLAADVQILAGLWTDVLVPAVRMLWELLTTVVLPVVAALAGWLKDNLPGAIQTVTNFLTGTLFPALNTIYTFISTNVIPILALAAQWLIANVPAAIQKTTDFFKNTLLPALDAIWSFIKDNVIPIITTLATSVFSALNAGVTTVTNFWKNTLLPALTEVWEFINGSIIPILTTLASVAIAALSVAVAALGAVWRTVLLPAITAIYEFINGSIIPIFKTLVDSHIAGLKAGFTTLSSFLAETVVPAFTKVYNVVSSTLSPAMATFNGVLSGMSGFFGNIADAVSGLIGWLNNLADKWNSMKPPDWVTGQSPPPMAEWFDYIAASVRNVTAELPALQMNLAATMPAASGISNSSVSNARSFTYAPQYSGVGAMEGPMDLALATSLAGV